MQRIQDDYLARLRRSMKGMTPEAIDEVEREIRNHIEDALADRDEDGVGALLDVLERLGPPEDFGPDVGLYVMVDRGYRDWSVPHMVRSTAFWSLGTMAGAVALLAFGGLFVGAAVLALAGLMRLIPDALFEQLAGAQAQAGRELAVGIGAVMLLAGLAALVGATALVRWFVGEYVRSARPHMLGGREADPNWPRRASRRILAVAVVGAALSTVSWGAMHVFGARVAGPQDPTGFLHLSTDAPTLVRLCTLAIVVGLMVFVLSPVLGLLWTRVAERDHSERAA